MNVVVYSFLPGVRREKCLGFRDIPNGNCMGILFLYSLLALSKVVGLRFIEGSCRSLL